MLVRTGLFALVAATAPQASGCFGDGRQNAHQPGHDLGAFTVTGTLASNTCGQGALGEQPTWQFPVHLARAPGIFYWNNGQAVIPGVLAADGLGFSFDTQVVMDMRSPDQVGPLPCSLARADHAQGTLDSATDTVSSFAGELSYSFTPTPGSQCDDLVSGAAPIVAALPCEMSYELSGKHQ